MGYIAESQLLKRPGWTAGLIHSLLDRPDRRPEPVPGRRRWTPPLYSVARVESAEATAEWARRQASREKARRRQATSDVIDGVLATALAPGGMPWGVAVDRVQDELDDRHGAVLAIGFRLIRPNYSPLWGRHWSALAGEIPREPSTALDPPYLMGRHDEAGSAWPCMREFPAGAPDGFDWFRLRVLSAIVVGQGQMLAAWPDYMAAVGRPATAWDRLVGSLNFSFSTPRWDEACWSNNNRVLLRRELLSQQTPAGVG
jgi:hypothetical protein